MHHLPDIWPIVGFVQPPSCIAFPGLQGPPAPPPARRELSAREKEDKLKASRAQQAQSQPDNRRLGITDRPDPDSDQPPAGTSGSAYAAVVTSTGKSASYSSPGQSGPDPDTSIQAAIADSTSELQVPKSASYACQPACMPKHLSSMPAQGQHQHQRQQILQGTHKG